MKFIAFSFAYGSICFYDETKLDDEAIIDGPNVIYVSFMLYYS